MRPTYDILTYSVLLTQTAFISVSKCNTKSTERA